MAHLDRPVPVLPGRLNLGGRTAWLLAWRNLAHDRARFIVTMVGVVFSVVLIAVQGGLFVGFTRSITMLIDNTRADIWVAAKGVRNFEMTAPLGDRHLYAALGTPGVAHAEKLIVRFAPWRKPQGGEESVIIVGFDPDSGLAGPWQVVAGDPADLRLPDAVMIDELYKDKLGIAGIGDEAEIYSRRVRVVGFTRGIRSFTTSPWVFVPYRHALPYTVLQDEQANYILVRGAAGVGRAALRAALAARIDGAEVFLTEELAARTTDYWMFTTGAGGAIVMGALLGLVVGVVIVAQVLYATTVDHLPEFGTLRAMGAPRGYVYRIILGQAAIAALLGHAIGSVIALALAHGSAAAAVSIVIPLPLAAALLLVTFAMCALAATISIRKAMRIDPAMVFQR